MTNKEIKIAYQEYDSLSELNPEDFTLATAAIEAVESSYAPYSNFNVGAAVMYEDGGIVKGSNQQNAAYPSGICADPVAPCGACRQVMIQYLIKGGMPVKIILIGADKILKFDRVESLLPFVFDNI